MAILVIFLGDEIANLGPIDFGIGLYIKVNDGQNKCDVLNPYLRTFGQNGNQLAQKRSDATLTREH